MTQPSDVDPADILTFWQSAGVEKWFAKDPSFDAEIRARFLWTYEAAVGGHHLPWEATADDALALTIVLDQFPRNMFRGTARAYAADPLARGVAERALAHGFDHMVAPTLRTFFYLPFEHSEALADQERSVALYLAMGDPNPLRYAEEHAKIIRRFGRFPSRNAVLGRISTPDEQAFLDAGGSAG